MVINAVHSSRDEERLTSVVFGTRNLTYSLEDRRILYLWNDFVAERLQKWFL